MVKGTAIILTFVLYHNGSYANILALPHTWYKWCFSCWKTQENTSFIRQVDTSGEKHDVTCKTVHKESAKKRPYTVVLFVLIMMEHCLYIDFEVCMATGCNDVFSGDHLCQYEMSFQDINKKDLIINWKKKRL
jgi:hypothetical protein